MKFGLLSGRGPAPNVTGSEAVEQIYAEARAAERAGFDSMLFSEHHQQDVGDWPNPLLLATAVAARTERLRVGSCVTLLPLHDAVRVAEDLATLDVLSHGRAILGVGLGYAPEDVTLLRRSAVASGVRMEESLTILNGAWEAEDLSLTGDSYVLDRARIRPKPVQTPRPPIWGGGLAEIAVDRCARLADAWISTSATSIAEVSDVAARYRAACAAHGAAPHVVVVRDAFITNDAMVPQEVKDGLFDTHGRYARMGRWDKVLAGRRWEELPFDELIRDRMIVGDPDHCRSEIARWVDRTSAEYFLLRFSHASGPPPEMVLECIERFGREVISRLAPT